MTAAPIYRDDVVITEVRDNNMSGASSLAIQLGGLASLTGMRLPTSGVGQQEQATLVSRRMAEEFIKRPELVADLVPESKKPPTLWSAVRRFQEEVLSIREDARKHVTTVSMEWRDPTVAARFANEYVALANEMIRARALVDANRNINYLNS